DAYGTRFDARLQPLPWRNARPPRRRGRGGVVMTAIDSKGEHPSALRARPSIVLFERGTPDEAGAALAIYRRETESLPDGATLKWHVDPGNLGLLSRAVRELEGAHPVDVVLRADDVAHDQTHVAHESELVPTLRRLRERASSDEAVRLLMS